MITLLANGQYKVLTEDVYKHLPTCEVAAEGRQMFFKSEGIYHKKYVCIATNPFNKGIPGPNNE